MYIHWTCIVSVFRKANLKMTTGLADIACITAWTCDFVNDLTFEEHYSTTDGLSVGVTIFSLRSVTIPITLPLSFMVWPSKFLSTFTTLLYKIRNFSISIYLMYISFSPEISLPVTEMSFLLTTWFTWPEQSFWLDSFHYWPLFSGH